MTVTTAAYETKTRAYGRLSDGTAFEIVKHLGSGRFEIRNLRGIGKARKYHTLTAEQRAVIAAHPIAVAIKATNIFT